jgi:hypothetical protein
MSDDLPLESDACAELSHMPGIKVLFADLHRVIADTCAMILNQQGFEAFPAHSVNEAVRIASEKAIDVAFIELLIGETDAIDAAVRILALRPYCRIVIWTGQPQQVASWVRREADEQFGGCEVLFKPIWPPDVMRIARGEPIPSYCTIPDDLRSVGGAQPETPVAERDCLSSSELHEYLMRSRQLVLGIMGEKRMERRKEKSHLN